MIFAVHPVNVESVAWIAQRKNTLSMLFFLLSILWYLKFLKLARLRLAAKHIPSTVYHPLSTFSSFILHPSSFHFWYWLSLSAFVLAMLSKGSVAVLPVLLLGIIWWLRPMGTVPIFAPTKMGLSPSFRRDLLRTAPFFVVAAVLAGVNVWFQTHGSGEVIRIASFTERLLGAGRIVWFYLYKAFLPFDLAFVYPEWHIQAGNPLWWLPLSAALIVTAVLWRYRESWSRPLFFAWGFFCVALAPVMGLTDVYYMKYALVADHYQYIAIIGMVALAAAGWKVWHERARKAVQWAATAIAIVTVGALAFLAWQQSRPYCDAVTLYRATLEKNPDCWLAHNNLSVLLIDNDQLSEAIEHSQEVLRLKPKDAEPHNNLGFALDKAGRTQEAIAQYQQSLEIHPDSAVAHNNYGLILARTGRLPEAIEHFKKAVRFKPDYPEAYLNLGHALANQGQPQEAINQLKHALRLRPDYAEAYNSLGFVLDKTGRQHEAIENYRQALVLKPDYPEAHYNLGTALANGGRLPEAIEHFKQALRAKPDYPEAHHNLGSVLADTGRVPEAIEHYKEALRLKPDLPDAHNSLGNILNQTGQPREAINHYQQALRARPDYPEAHNNLGVALSKEGRLQEAIAHFMQAIEHKPDYPDAYYNLALTYKKASRPADAMAAAQKALSIARSQGQTAMVKEIEDWLKSNRARLPNPQNTPPPAQSAPPSP
jgi:tetratricopeptide (TPR) repeat protein